MSSDYRVLNSSCQRNSIEDENWSAFKRRDMGDRNLHEEIYRVKHTCQRKEVDQCGWKAYAFSIILSNIWSFSWLTTDGSYMLHFKYKQNANI